LGDVLQQAMVVRVHEEEENDENEGANDELWLEESLYLLVWCLALRPLRGRLPAHDGVDE